MSDSAKPDLELLYNQANEYINGQNFLPALNLLREIIANSEPVRRQETPTEIMEAYQGIPDDIQNIQGRSIGGKKITLIIDYFTASCYLAGYCLVVMKEYSEALDHLKQALFLWPRNNTIRHEIAYTCVQLKQFNEALIILQDALENDSSDDIANKEIAWLYNEQGLYEQAIPYAKKAVALNPGFDQAYEELYIAYSKTGKTEEAEELEKIMENLKI